MALANIHAAEPASLNVIFFNFSRNRGSTVFGLTAAVISLSTYSERRHAVKFNDAVFRTALVPWKKGKMTVNNKDQSPAGKEIDLYSANGSRCFRLPFLREKQFRFFRFFCTI
jgi:hypothetical protein